MTDIRFRCPACSAKLSIASDAVDLVVDCPVCRAAIRAWGAPLLDVRFRCPMCRAKLVIDSQAVGREIVCPSCDKVVVVPKPYDPATDAKPQATPSTTSGALLTDAEVKFLSGDERPGG